MGPIAILLLHKGLGGWGWFVGRRARAGRWSGSGGGNGVRIGYVRRLG